MLTRNKKKIPRKKKYDFLTTESFTASKHLQDVSNMVANQILFLVGGPKSFLYKEAILILIASLIN